MTKERIDVLLIEDDEDDVFLTRRLLEKARAVTCELTWKQDFEEGVEAVCSGAFDVGLVDYRLGARDGLHLLKAARAQGVLTPLILLTGQGDPEVDRQALEAGAADYLAKDDLDAETLERSIRYARRQARSRREIHRQAALLDEAHDAICAYDLDGCVTYSNERAARMTGYEDQPPDLYADDCLYRMDSEVVDQAWETVLEEGTWSGELHQTTKDGETITVESRWSLVRDAAGEPDSVLVLNTDVTERKRLQQQSLRAQRMESVGRLASGIAHDLGNLLMPIQLGVRVLEKRYAEADEKAPRTLQMIDRSAERGLEMVERVLAFARGVEGERVALPLCDVVEEVEHLVEESFPDDITFESDLPAELPCVEGDATQLQQVLVNLSVNARDAMPDGGHLTLTAEPITLDDGDAALAPSAAPGDYVHLRVCDTGTGIPPDVIGEVFEPFFSTKSDDGTGLGLSTVYSIVQSHGGFVDVQSEEGAGTTFDVFLPTADPEAGERSATNGREAHDQNERVLILDDDPALRKTIAATLENAGFQPLPTARADEAQRLLEEHPVEAVLTDVALPDADGLDVLRTFKERRPDVPVVVCSGRTDSQIEAVRAAGADHFLPKPFDAAALCEALDAVLSSEREKA